MSSALRNNTVSRIFSSSSTQKKTQIDFFTQTLTQLYLFSLLQSNQIGDKGAEHLSSALRNNTVSRIFSSSSTQKKTQIDFFTQTLTQLNLGSNQIGEKGAEHLSSALRNNTVSRIFSSSSTQKKTQIDFFTQTLTVLNLSFNRIKSETKEQNICLLHFETTQ